MDIKNLNELFDYAVRLRRDIHEYPEIGFDLPRTTALVTEELKKMGYAPSHAYGVCSVVAEVGEGEELLLLRADMDALPVEEINDLPFKSKVAGKMHACGHDSHTAILLAVAKYLKAHEGELTRRVRLIFQPAEESAVSGAKMMMDAGVMEGVTEAVCTHCDNTVPVGQLVICPGDYMAACVPLSITFIGKTSHAAFPENGVDAVAMGVEAYNAMKAAVAKEAGGSIPYIWCNGRLSGGTAHNVVPDRCEMDISFRFYDMDFASRVESRVRAICAVIAEKFGGKCEIDWKMSTVPVHNDEAAALLFEKTIKEAGMQIGRVTPRMSSEDFGWILAKGKGFIFRFGTRNEAKGCTGPSHKNTFMIDEDGMKTAIEAFLTYACR
ncbi:MAG: amidohydrolase [Ruminococcaceae bacterium]|nr:amidohydrolase [Oscillospiraceae bacterium]